MLIKVAWKIVMIKFLVNPSNFSHVETITTMTLEEAISVTTIFTAHLGYSGSHLAAFDTNKATMTLNDKCHRPHS